MPTARISVVVPVYNNQAQLAQCLASIAAQTFADLEVIVVDDGSTDSSGQIAAAQAAADDRFTVLTVPNGGPGSARNRGISAASGEFLAFVDADDELPPDAYAIMLRLMERTRADFVSGGVLRISATGLAESGLHARAIKADRDRTHITRTPQLFYDISVWNKLFRRSFWDACGLAFPEAMVWEDLVAMTEAHVLASAVTVTTEPVYHWRDRDQGSPSITQSRTSIANFADRITALEMIDAFLRRHGSAAMLRHHQHKALVNDLWLYVRDLPRTPAEYQAQFISLSRRYLAGVSPKIIGRLPAGHKLAYYLIERELGTELAQFASWLAGQPGRTPPLVRGPGGLRADLPFRQDRTLKIPGRVFRPHRRELDPFVEVEGIGWEDGRLVVTGCAYIPSVDISKRRHATKIVVLRPAGRSAVPIVTIARTVRHATATARSGQRRYGYEWSGFRCEIDPRRFRTGPRWVPGGWDCFILVRGRGVWRPARLHTPAAGAEHPAARQVAPGLALAPAWHGRRLRIELRRAVPAAGTGARDDMRPVIDEHGWAPGGRLIARGRLPAGPPGDWDLVLRRSGDGDQHVITVSRDGDPAPDGDSGRDDYFSVAVDVAALPVFGDVVPLRDGRWQILMRRRPGIEEQGGRAVADPPQPPGLGPAAQAKAADQVTIGPKVYSCGAEAAQPVLTLTAGPALRLAERGRIRRRLLRQLYYPLQRLLALRDRIVFISFGGKQCGDNPRGIADELRRRHDAREQIWVVSDWSVPVPDGARAVLLGSQAYFAALGRSRYLIANDHMPQPFRKRAGQHYVQTWHGAPFKRIGYEIAAPRFASGDRYFSFLAGDVAQWDLLLSPSPHGTPILRRSFRYGGDICESGYPRNDVLYGAGAQARAEQVRRRLGLPAGRKVALYAPTWRDDQHDGSGGYRIDFALDLGAAARRLAAGYVLLIRGHHLMDSGLPASMPPGFALDVTRYPDIADLLLITDVLITDYSSVIFDFAPAGRPILFFTYDLAAYRDQLRGFSFDFEADAPGPLLGSSDDVIAALEDLDSVIERYRNVLAAFAGRFCSLDDGKSASRACERIFAG